MTNDLLYVQKQKANHCGVNAQQMNNKKCEVNHPKMKLTDHVYLTSNIFATIWLNVERELQSVSPM